MAGTVVTTEITHGIVKKIKFAWTCGTGADEGKADATTTNYYSGRFIGLITVPDGVAAPTDDYDITISDSDGVDLLLGAGANRDTANTEFVAEASMAGVAMSKLTLAVRNAGDTKKGTIYLLIR